jgi:hypothetical protein
VTDYEGFEHREEDLEIAADFFELFGATAPLLDDPAENLLAVSAFNDNGLKQLVDEGESLDQAGVL